jgi:leader peptidase (prepilin peptidase)/N-methyltransferase
MSAASILGELPLSPIREIAALLFGLAVGSFANVVVFRLPAGRSLSHPGSRCPRCEAPIRAWQNVPVLSWLALRGRCASCREPIAWRYLAVELANGLLWMGLAATGPLGPRMLFEMALVTALLVLGLIDLDHQILPDAITLPVTAAGLVASLLPGWPITPLGALAAAAGGWAAMALVATAYRQARGVEGLGQGDWKMAAMLGACLGWQPLLLTIFLATLSGTLVGAGLMVAGRSARETRLPLGSFLALAAIVVVFAGHPILRWYAGFYDV